MADTAAALLDELMGKNRNVLPNEEFVEKSWEDPDVCKDYLCGFCPNQLFTNTRSDLGACDKIHDDHLKKQFQESPSIKTAHYHDMFLAHLQRIMGDVGKRIQRGQSRLMTNQEKNLKLPSQVKEEARIKMLTERINELLVKVEELGCQGDVEEAQGVMRLCDQLKDEREQLQTATDQAVELLFSQEKQMEVCQICGAFLIVNDSQSRVDDHLMGKQHMGYARIKATLEEIQSKKKQAEDDRINTIRKEREDREAAREAEREERLKRQEERERQREKERKERRSKRSRSRDRRSRSRSRDRSRRSRRSRSRDRKRSRDRSRDRDRDRSHRRSSRRSRSRDRRRSRSRDRRRSRSRDSRSRRSHSRSHRSSRHHSEERRKDDRDRERGDSSSKRDGSQEKKEGGHAENGSDSKEEGEIEYTAKGEGTSEGTKEENKNAEEGTEKEGEEDGELPEEKRESEKPAGDESTTMETEATETETKENEAKETEAKQTEETNHPPENGSSVAGEESRPDDGATV